MPTLVHCVLCQQYTIDSKSNVVSLFNVVEELGFPAVAFVKTDQDSQRVARSQGNLFLYCLWTFEWPEPMQSAPFNVGFRIKTAGGYAGVVNRALANAANGGSARARTFVEVEGFTIDDPGMYEFQVLLDDEVVGRLPLSITVLQENSKSTSMDLVPDGI